MKRILIVSALIVFVIGNLISIQIMDNPNLSLNNLKDRYVANAEEVVYKFHCHDTEWRQYIGWQCYPSGDQSYCDYYERICSLSTSGKFENDASCSSIWCYDCVTDLGDFQYNDCDI